ncbi:hypothetical protein BDV29DRAFT_191782 [Aspergillus leporis]|uniref:Uncharacterized protein n=1 Tax=Aspergillus leporis TaxID=41062 RepID=A0A5N5WXR7_9EURO|nr:hypothetical protein BDV29DRAFT_191782 [Aspergillus leporis]
MSPKSKSSPSLFLPPGLPPPTRELRSADSGLALPLSTRAIFNEIVHRLYTINEFTELVYEAVSPEKGSLICRSLAESKIINFNSLTGTLWIRVMPTELHDVHQRWVIHAYGKWLATGLINDDEYDLLDVGDFSGFTGAYTNSSKEPDLFLRPGTSDLPRIVMESGLSESWPRLHADQTCVKGTAEVWSRDAAGGLAIAQSIFPQPTNLAGGTDTFGLTKGQVFGQHMVPGQDPNAVLYLDLSKLRDYALERMGKWDLHRRKVRK